MKDQNGLWILVTISGASMVLVMCVNLVSIQIEACPQYCECSSAWPVKVVCTDLPSLELIATGIFKEIKILEMTGCLFTSLNDMDINHLPKQIEVLSITKGQLQQLNGETFKNLTNLRNLKLNNNNITTIPGNAFLGSTYLRTLDLSNNTLQGFMTETFKPLTYLTNLNLSYCNLSDLPSGLFSANTNLLELVISGNAIENLRGTSFQGLSSLRSLIARHCDIRTIENDFFQQMKMLELLDLSHNAMQALPNEGKLTMFRNLKYLTLVGNQLTSLTDGILQNLNLTTLDLSNNLITSLGENSFIDAVLHNLDMSGNQIQSLPENIFQPIASTLVTLKLNSNRNLKTLPMKIFNGMSALQILELSSCSLVFLSSEHFEHVKRLQEIDVSNNNLQSLPETFFNNTIHSVTFDNNPWHCDCHIRSLRDWLKTHNTSALKCVSITSYRCPKPTCSSPVNLLHKEIQYLEDADLETCFMMAAITGSTSAPVTIVVGVLAGVVLIVLVTVVVICCLYRMLQPGKPLPRANPNGDMRNKEPKKSEEKHVLREKVYEKTKKKEKYYTEKKVKRTIIDPEIVSLNESDKSFVVRNYFHSMAPDEMSEGTGSMTKKGSEESLSQSGYGYGSCRNSKGSRDSSSQYSHNAGCRFESAV